MAQADLAARAEDVAARYPVTNEGWSVRARYLRDEWIPPVTRVAAAAQFVQVGFILLIVCANVANLMLARASARGYETVMKGALGATRGRLVRQSITEGIVLASLGGMLGIYMATWGDVWIKSLILVPTPYWVQFPFDRTALAFSLLAVLVTGVGISVLPALRGSRLDLTRMMKGNGGGAGAGGGTLRRLLVASQFALSAILVSGALLLARSYLTIDDAEDGYATDGIVTMRVSLAGGAYEDPRQRLGYLDRAIDRLGRTRIVESAGAVSALPASREGFAPTVTFEVEGEVRERGEARIATRHVVTGGYLETMEIPIVDGRPFTAAEVDGGSDVVLLSDGLARRAWPDGVRVGRQVRLAGEGGEPEPGPWLTVVGITRDVEPPAQVLGLDAVPADQLYLPYGARPAPFMTLALRTGSDALGAVAPLRAELQALDQTVPIYDALTMPQVLDIVHWVPRLWSQTFLGVRRAGAPDVGHGRLRRDRLRRQPAPARDRCPDGAGRAAGTHRESRAPGRRAVLRYRSGRRLGGGGAAGPPHGSTPRRRASERRRRLWRRRPCCSWPSPCARRACRPTEPRASTR